MDYKFRKFVKFSCFFENCWDILHLQVSRCITTTLGDYIFYLLSRHTVNYALLLMRSIVLRQSMEYLQGIFNGNYSNVKLIFPWINSDYKATIYNSLCTFTIIPITPKPYSHHQIFDFTNVVLSLCSVSFVPFVTSGMIKFNYERQFVAWIIFMLPSS